MITQICLELAVLQQDYQITYQLTILAFLTYIVSNVLLL